jgi:hypothetical protein
MYEVYGPFNSNLRSHKLGYCGGNNFDKKDFEAPFFVLHCNMLRLLSILIFLEADNCTANLFKTWDFKYIEDLAN